MFIKEIKNFSFIIIGILLAGTGIHGFLLSSNFIDGGITGVSMLLSKAFGVPLWILIPLINLPFLILGYKHLGIKHCIRSALAILGLALALAYIHYPDFTHDKVLTAIFGGFCLGAGVGLTIRGKAVLDGTEIAALILSKKSQAFKVGDLILAFNIVLFISAIKVIGIENCLYSILTFVSAAKTLDFVLYGLEEFTACTIISSSSGKVKDAILNQTGRGVTVYKGQGGVSGEDQEILSCVVTRLEIGQIRSIIEEIDPTAFFTMHALGDVQGGRVRRASFH